jgi:hypothetical protein
MSIDPAASLKMTLTKEQFRAKKGGPSPFDTGLSQANPLVS